MTKLTDAFRNSANAPKNRFFVHLKEPAYLARDGVTGTGSSRTAKNVNERKGGKKRKLSRTGKIYC
jgi:hypothetical protein